MGTTMRMLGIIIALGGANLVLCGILTQNAGPLIIGAVGIPAGLAAIVSERLPDSARSKVLWIVATVASASFVLVGVLTLSAPFALMGLCMLGPALVGLLLMPPSDSFEVPLPSWTVHIGGVTLVVAYIVYKQAPAAGVVALALLAIVHTAVFFGIAMRARSSWTGGAS